MTTLQLSHLRELLQNQDYSIVEAAAETGITKQQAYYWCRKMGLPNPRPRIHNRNRLNCYTAYDRKTDELIAVGTIHEISAACGVKGDTVREQMCRGDGPRLYVRVDCHEEN